MEPEDELAAHHAAHLTRQRLHRLWNDHAADVLRGSDTGNSDMPGQAGKRERGAEHRTWLARERNREHACWENKGRDHDAGIVTRSLVSEGQPSRQVRPSASPSPRMSRAAHTAHGTRAHGHTAAARGCTLGGGDKEGRPCSDALLPCAHTTTHDHGKVVEHALECQRLVVMQPAALGLLRERFLLRWHAGVGSTFGSSHQEEKGTASCDTAPRVCLICGPALPTRPHRLLARPPTRQRAGQPDFGQAGEASEGTKGKLGSKDVGVGMRWGWGMGKRTVNCPI